MTKTAAQVPPTGTIRDIEECATATEAAAIFLKFIEQYGFKSYLIGRMANPASQSKNDILTNWPSEWIDRWVDQNYVFHDPIFQYAIRHRSPFLWSTAFKHGTKIGKKIIRESREYNLYDGIAIPITTDFGPLGCVSIGCDSGDFDTSSIPVIELVCIHLYQHLQMLDDCSTNQMFGLLTKRETEVLHFVAEGKTNWEIGKILNLSEFSVKDHVQNLTRKLQANNRTQAVSVAIRNSLIIP